MDRKKIELIIGKKGYNDFKWISGLEVVVSQWPRFKCMFGCAAYGKTGTCPPSVPSISECREFFSEYENIAVIHIQKKCDDPEHRKEWSRQTNLHLLKLEKEAFLAGYHKAFLLFMDECLICEVCPGTRIECENLHLSRPSPEALGVDIFATDAKQHGFDLVISHHPPDRILGDGFVKVLDRHRELMEQAGVDPVRAQQASDENKAFWQKFAKHADKGKTYETITSVARELNIALMNIHLPCDEIGRKILQKKADQLGPDVSVSSLANVYSAIPEIQASDEEVQIICGKLESRIGKVAVIHATGVNGGYPVANALFDFGIDTVVYIHLFFQEEREKLKQENKGTLIVTGHYGSDSIGINPLINKLESYGIEVVCCNSLIRK